MDTLRQAIRAAASRQKWSIGALDRQLRGEGGSLVKDILAGRSQNPTIGSLVDIADALGVSFYEVIGAVDLGNQAKVNAVADAVACLAGLLEVAQIDDATEDALLAAFPPTLQAAQRAREAGHDVQASVSAIALHMWHQLRPEDLQQ